MDNLYGQIDLTVLGKLVRQHPDLVKKVNFKDGEHQLINVDIFEKQQQDQYGNVATIKASCKKDQQKEGLSYYLANLKKSQYQNENQQQGRPQTAAPQSQNDNSDDLPFRFRGVAA